MLYKKKINWLLVLQGWAMLWVVIGHAFVGDLSNQINWPFWERGLMGFAYSFHMPLFMLVSGWLFYYTRLKINESYSGRGGYKWTYLSIVKDKALRILLPGFVFSIIALAVKVVFPGDVARQVGLSLHDIAWSYLYPFDNPFRELWFVAALFWMFLLAPIWQWAIKKQWTKWGMLVVLLALHFWHPEIMLFSLDRVFLLAIWFYMGIIISKEEMVVKFVEPYPWITLILGLIIYTMGFFTVAAFLKTLGGIIFSFAFAILADKYIPKLFFSFRDYTYQIFLIGIFAQMFVKIMYRHILMPYVVAYILCIILGLYVPVLVSKLIEKTNWKPLLLCVGLKPKK